MSVPALVCYRFPAAQRTLTVRLDAPELSPLLESFYAGYRCPAPQPREAAEPTISLERENGGVYRLIGPSGNWEAYDAGEAVLYYESELTGALLDEAGAYVHLHGAAVCRGARCITLLGPSGAGKSTLTLGLRLRGAWALADDALLLDPESGEVHPFERSIRVHEASLTGLGVDAVDVAGATVCEPYLWLKPQRPEPTEPKSPSAFVFLESGRTTSLVRVSAAETLKRALVARLGSVVERDFECLARLAAQVPGYGLVYRSFPEALAELEPLWE